MPFSYVQLFLERNLRQCCRQNRNVKTKWAFRQFLKASMPLHLEAVTHSLEAVDQISHNINTSGETVRLNRFKGGGIDWRHI
jgi:hypothetical protein